VKVVYIVACFLLAGRAFFPCAFASQEGSGRIRQDDRVIPFCELIRHPEQYHGKLIRTTAMLASGPEISAFYDDACKQSHPEEDVVAVPTFANGYRFDSGLDNKLRKIEKKHLIARVTVLAVFTDSGGRIFGHMACCRYKLEIQQLLAVDRVGSPARRWF
jgi:hypothetical protein